MGTAARRQDYDYLIKLLLIGDSGELAIVLRDKQTHRVAICLGLWFWLQHVLTMC